MKLPYATALAAPLLLATSCSKEGGAGAKAAAEPPLPAHPWDWDPEDATLVSGRTIYMAECALCHNEGEEGAPSLEDAAEWETRKAKGIAVLVDHAINGFTGEDGEMPARGGTDSLTDEEVSNAVNYMVATPK